MRSRPLLLCLAATLVAAALAVPAAATARDRAAVRAFTDRYVTTALGTVDANGHLRDPTRVTAGRGNAYGPAAFGYAGLRTAERRHDAALRAVALRALTVPVRERLGDPFNLWLVAKAYRWASRRLSADPAWRAAAPSIERYLDDPPATNLTTGFVSDRYYDNWKLVDLAGRADALAAGRRALDAAGRRRIAAITRLALAAAAPRAATSFVRGPARALSDPPEHPLAYTTFSAAQLQEALAARPGLVAPRLRRRYADAVRYVLAVAAPDGDVAWSGRSMEQSWSLAAAMTLGARRGGPDGLGLAHAAWRRLRTTYGLRPDDGWLAIAPVATQGASDLPGLDSYAGAVVYGGLTAVLLNDAADALGRRALRGGPPSAHAAGRLWDPRGAGVAAQRAGAVWWGASVRPSAKDLRWQPGLQQVKVRHHGRWADVLPARPPLGGAGPLWPAPEGCVWRAAHRDTLRCAAGTLRLSAAGGRVRLALRVHPGEAVTGRLYLPGAAPDGAMGLRWAAGTLVASAPLTVTVDPAAHSSATHDGLHAVTFSARADAGGRVVFSVGR